MDTNQYMGMFLEESREHLQTLNSCVLDLENDPENLSVLSEIFRSAHTIKGMSATMGFTTIAELTHEMENILDLLRKGQLKASHDIIDTIFKCVDTLEQLVESVATNSESSIDSKPLIVKLKALAKGETVLAPVAKTTTTVIAAENSSIELSDTEIAVIKKARSQGMQAYEVQISLREGCL
jgi:two-component system chemotaxis sensor kinase CheA